MKAICVSNVRGEVWISVDGEYTALALPPDLAEALGVALIRHAGRAVVQQAITCVNMPDKVKV